MSMFSGKSKTLASKVAGVVLVAAGALLSAPASAGNIFLTGHDDDLHGSFEGVGSPPDNQLAAALAFVRNGSSLPVLTFDAGSQLTSVLTALGVSFFNVNPSSIASITAAGGAALFDSTKYSAFAVASVSTCGGCDNPVGTGLNIASFSSAITAFFNDGRGILGLAGATDLSAYAYVPESATSAGGSPPSSGFVQTADGATLGIPAVNGDATHNFFSEPGSSGLSAAYKVVERLGSATTGTPESVALVGGTIVCTGPTCVITVPEPGTLALLGVALFGVAALRRRTGARV